MSYADGEVARYPVAEFYACVCHEARAVAVCGFSFVVAIAQIIDFAAYAAAAAIGVDAFVAI